MDLSFEELEDVIKLAKSHNLAEFEFRGLRVKFDCSYPDKKTYEPIADPKQDAFKPISPLDNFSPEEILYYATPFYDDLQAEKEAKNSRIEASDVK